MNRIDTFRQMYVAWSCLCAVLCYLPVSGSVQTEGNPSVLGFYPVWKPGQERGDVDSDGRLIFLSSYTYVFNLYVVGWSANTSCVRLVENSGSCETESGQYKKDLVVEESNWYSQHNCSIPSSGGNGDECSSMEHVRTINVSFPDIRRDAVFYFCAPASVADFCNSTDSLSHQGSYPWLAFGVKYIPPPEAVIELPLAVRIIFILILLVFSGLFSGLNLGLMSLDLTSLKIVMESGNKRQKWCAQKIYPVRKHGNYLLCSILFSNVAVNSTITVLMGDITSGAIAIIGSTFGIVIFGEIIPQAICSRFGLYIGAGTIWLTYICMVITFPMSLPMSLILNRILGQELGASYNRNELLQLLKITKGKTDIKDEEVDIIFGALCLKDKSIEDVMTKLSNVFCLDIERVLNFETIQEIYESGHSRIPIYEGGRNNIVGLLYTRNLAFLDPEDEMTLKQYHNFYQHKPLEEWRDTKLDLMLERFVNEHRHLALVKWVECEDEDSDPIYEVKGIVTLEDIIEEILQREIIDESDRYVNNEMLIPTGDKSESRVPIIKDIVSGGASSSALSSSQKLAVFQVLSASVEPFTVKYISAVILRKIIQMHDVVQDITCSETNPFLLYEAGKEAHFFTLIIEGSAEVTIGTDGMTFDCRSFSQFGKQALLNVLSTSGQAFTPYVPDFTVQLMSDSVLLTVTQKQYSLAYHSSRMANSALATGDDDEGISSGNGVGASPKRDLEDTVVGFHKQWTALGREESEVENSGSVSWFKKLKIRVSKAKHKGEYQPLLRLSELNNEIGGDDSKESSA